MTNRMLFINPATGVFHIANQKCTLVGYVCALCEVSVSTTPELFEADGPKMTRAVLYGLRDEMLTMDEWIDYNKDVQQNGEKASVICNRCLGIEASRPHSTA